MSTNKVKIKINSEQANALQTFLQSNKKEWSRPIPVSEIIDALRKKDYKTVSKILKNANNPGCYKWWATENNVNDLLKQLYGKKYNKDIFEQIKDILEYDKKTDLYCIYVGKANDIFDRLKTHAKDIEHSTLRRTICSLINKEQITLTQINEKIDNELKKLKVQYFPLNETQREIKERIIKNGKKFKDIELKGVETKCTLLDLEYFIINENFHILNVDENHYANYQHKIKHTSNEKITHQTEEIKNMLKEKKAKWSKKSIQNLKTNKQ